MSTTRWIIETTCEHGSVHARHGGCLGGSRLVVDPDNLPPEAIERANRTWHDEWLKWARSDIDWNMAEADALRIVESIIRVFLSDPEPPVLKPLRGPLTSNPAFLSDPEPGDQT